MTVMRGLVLFFALPIICGVAEAGSWIVRPVDGCDAAPGNVEVLVDSFDGLAVCYARGVVAGRGYVDVAKIDATQKLFSRKTDASGGNMASFAMDDYANIYWSAGSFPGGPTRVGQDMRGLGGMISANHPFYSQIAPATMTSMAVDGAGLPTLAGVDTDGYCFLSRFDPIAENWSFALQQELPKAAKKPGFPPQILLDYDEAGRAVLAYREAATQQVAVVRETVGGWEELARQSVSADTGRSLACSPDGAVGMAYVDASNRLVYGYTSSTGFTVEKISSLAGNISPRGLAYNPLNGRPSLVYSASTPTPYAQLYLANRGADGVWTTEALPAMSRNASLAFDSAGSPIIAAMTLDKVVLIGQNIPMLVRGDFDLDGTVTSGDVNGFVQAVNRSLEYLQANPGATKYDIILLGDYVEDDTVDAQDARRFLDSLATGLVAGLPTRTSGYIAFDLADQDPSLGSGTGNFFATALATPKLYTPGDARGDLSSGEPGNDGTPDRIINAADIDYLFAHLDGSDDRADLNEDSQFSPGDVAELVAVILGTHFGDANLDGFVNHLDAAALAENWQATSGVGWAGGDFNGDGRTDDLDAVILAANWNAATTPHGSVPEPNTTALLLSALTSLLFFRTKKISAN